MKPTKKSVIKHTQDFDENGVDHIFYTQDQVFHNQQFEMFDQDIIFTEKE